MEAIRLSRVVGMVGVWCSRVGSVHERVTVIWHGNEFVKQVMTKLKKKYFLVTVT